jgi:hypothetical protein
MQLSPLAPLVIGEKAVTSDEARHHLLDWLEKVYQVDGLSPEPKLLKNEEWKPFAHAVVWEVSGDPRRLTRLELRSMAQELAPVAKEHPVSALLVGTILMGQPGSLRLLETAAKDFSEKAGSETLAFRAAAGLALASPYEDAENVTKQRVEAAMVAFRKALDAEGGYAKHHDRVIAYVLMSGLAGDLFASMHERMAAEVAKTEGMKPWAKKWIEGQHCLQKAWDMRGGGYAITVSEYGNALFIHESEKARRLLQEAWEMKPEDPIPAVNLIYSSLSMGKQKATEHMRKWFDEVLKMQVDAPDAAQHFMWGLRPRWYGSHQQMKDFGLACANTERFDSGLPWMLLQAHRDCASEWDVPDAYFKEVDSQSYDSLCAVFEGAEKEAKRTPWRSVDRTQAAVFEFKCGHYEEAQKWLQKLDAKPNGAVLDDWGGMDADLLVGKTAAYAKGNVAAQLRQAEGAEHGFQAGNANRIYRGALEMGKDNMSDAGRQYLESRVAITEIEKDLAERSAAALMPDAAFRAWSRRGGGWKLDDHVLTHWGRGRVSSSTCQARIGPSFTVEGELEITDPGENCEVWLAYGYPERRERTRWIAVRFAYDHGKTKAMLSNGLGEPLEEPEIKVQPRFKFKVVAGDQGMSLFVDNAPAFENVPLPTGFVKELFGQIGLGAATHSDQTRVKIHSLTVTR